MRKGHLSAGTAAPARYQQPVLSHNHMTSQKGRVEAGPHASLPVGESLEAKQHDATPWHLTQSYPRGTFGYAFLQL